MAITVNFRTASGDNTTRKFKLSEGVSVFGKLSGVTGMFQPFTFYRVQVFDKNNILIYFKENTTDIFGGYDAYFVTPSESQKLNVQIDSTYTISGSDTTIIPISCGDVSPDIAPNPETEKTFFDYLPLLVIIFLGAFLYLTFLRTKNLGV